MVDLAKAHDDSLQNDMMILHLQVDIEPRHTSIRTTVVQCHDDVCSRRNLYHV